MENFTADSLKKFINSGGSVRSNKPANPSTPLSDAQTARGQRVADILRNKPSDSQQKPPISADVVIRHYLGEHVRDKMKQHDMEGLKKSLLEHREFIDDILALLEQTR